MMIKLFFAASVAAIACTVPVAAAKDRPQDTGWTACGKVPGDRAPSGLGKAGKLSWAPLISAAHRGCAPSIRTPEVRDA